MKQNVTEGIGYKMLRRTAVSFAHSASYSTAARRIGARRDARRMNLSIIHPVQAVESSSTSAVRTQWKYGFLTTVRDVISLTIDRKENPLSTDKLQPSPVQMWES
jgi:hypothetical protein